MRTLIILAVVAAVSCTPLGGYKRSYDQYEAPSVYYTYEQPASYPASSQYYSSSQYSPSSQIVAQEFSSPSYQYVPQSQQYQTFPQSAQYAQYYQQPQYYQQEFVATPQNVVISPEIRNVQYDVVPKTELVTSQLPVANVVSVPQYAQQAYTAPLRQWSTSESSSQSASSYSEHLPAAGYNTNSFRVSQPVQAVYSAPAGRRWDAVRNTWC